MAAHSSQGPNAINFQNKIGLGTIVNGTKIHSSPYRVSVENKIERLVFCLKHCFKIVRYNISEAFVNGDNEMKLF